jgi:hypothetical protein
MDQGQIRVVAVAVAVAVVMVVSLFRGDGITVVCVNGLKSTYDYF